LEQSPGMSQLRPLQTSYPSFIHDRLLHFVEVQSCASQTRGSGLDQLRELIRSNGSE